MYTVSLLSYNYYNFNDDLKGLSIRFNPNFFPLGWGRGSVFVGWVMFDYVTDAFRFPMTVLGMQFWLLSRLWLNKQ